MKAKTLLGALVLAMLLSGCGNSAPKVDTEGQNMDAVVKSMKDAGMSDEEIAKVLGNAPQGESAPSNENSEKLAELFSGKFEAEGKTLQFPMTVGEFAETMGAEFEDMDKMLYCGEMRRDIIVKDDYNFHIRFENPNTEDTPKKDCVIYAVEFGFKENTDPVKLPCGFKNFDKRETVENTFGEYEQDKKPTNGFLYTAYNENKLDVKDGLAGYSTTGNKVRFRFKPETDELDNCYFYFPVKNPEGERIYKQENEFAITLPAKFLFPVMQDASDDNIGGEYSDENTEGILKFIFKDPEKFNAEDGIKKYTDECDDAEKIETLTDNADIALLDKKLSELPSKGHDVLGHQMVIFDKKAGRYYECDIWFIPDQEHSTEGERLDDKIAEPIVKCASDILGTFKSEYVSE